MPAYKNEKLALIDQEIAEQNGVTDEELEDFCLP